MEGTVHVSYEIASQPAEGAAAAEISTSDRAGAGTTLRVILEAV